MATRIKGITIEFDGNTVKLQNALKEVNRMTAETQRGLKDVSRLLKIDLGNTSLLAQNVEVLTDQVQNTKLKLNELNTAYDKLKENGVDENSTEIQALYREIIDMGNRLKTLEKQLQSFGSVGAQKITAACVKVKEMGSKINKTKATVKVGNTYQIIETLTPKGTVTYKSSKTSVAKVSSKGVVTGVKKGKAKITVKANGVTKKVTITVKK